MNSRYGQLRIPKTVNVIIKIFYVDIVIVFAGFFCGLGAQQIAIYVGLQDIYQMALMAYGAIVGITLAMPTPLAPQVRLYQVLLNIVHQDKNKYYPIFIEGKNESKGK